MYSFYENYFLEIPVDKETFVNYLAQKFLNKKMI